MENLSLKKSLKTLSDGVSANLRPLYNSNMAKVSTVMWSQNWIFVATFLENPCFQCNFKNID